MSEIFHLVQTEVYFTEWVATLRLSPADDPHMPIVFLSVQHITHYVLQALTHTMAAHTALPKFLWWQTVRSSYSNRICGTVTRARPKSGLSKEIRVTTGKNSNEVHLVGQWTCQSINTQKALVPQRLMHLLKFKPLTSPSEWQWASHIKLKKNISVHVYMIRKWSTKVAGLLPHPPKELKASPHNF